MAGNATFESASASSCELGFSGTHLNGQRWIRSAAVGSNLDRPGNFREGSESRMFGSGFAVPRGGSSAMIASNDLHTLSQCMSLEPIVMGDQKISWYGELRRVMGISVGSTAEENSFVAAAAHLKPLPPVAVVKDLKHFRSSLVDTCVKARDRANKIDEHLHKLDKYCEAVSSKKQQRSELVTNDRAGALNLKMGTQIYSINQRVEDRPKNILLNKRVRTSVAESRAECQSNGLQRQPVTMAKDGNLPEDNGGESDLFEKIRRLAAGGDRWDTKIKRKRSVGTVFTRPIDNDGEPKRPVQNKVVDERGSQPHDAQICRLGVSNGTGGSSKSDTTSLPNSSSTGLSPKNERGAPILPRDLTAGSNKERIITKENSKLNNRDDDCYITCPSPVTKSKASRTARTGSMVAASSSPGIPHIPGTLQSWENATVEDKILSHGGGSNHKRPMPQGSSSPPMAHWVGQRPQKMSRARRVNLVAPVSNQDEKQLSFESCSPSDVGARLASNGTNGSPIFRNATNGPQKLIGKLDNIQSPLRLSESEESVGGESRLKDKEMGNREVDAIAVQNIGPSVTLANKNKPLINEESGNGVWRQGRNGNGPLIARSSISPMGNRLDNAATPKPLQSSKTGYKKNGSKSGRRLRRLSDHKGFSHHVPLQNSSAPDCTGGSDDDQEELLAAANHARIASHLACSSAFWKKMEPIFASVSSEDKSFLSQQLKSVEEIREGFPQLLGRGNNSKVGVLHEDSVSDALTSVERKAHMRRQESESFSARLDLDKTSNGFIPLYQTVLSALIIEDDIDGLEEGNAINIQVQNAFCVSTYDTYCLNDSEPRERARMENECDTAFGIHAQSLHSAKKSFPSNGGINSLRSCIINNSTCEDVHSEVELLGGISKSFLNRPQMLQMEGLDIFSRGCQYEQMCLDDKLLLELQSIGLCPDTLPDLDDKENETIQHEVDKLKTRLHQQEVKKKAYLEKICKGVGSNSGVRDLETLAMDRLVELAYRKLLATRRTSRSGAQKVPKQVALAFGRRTLARCRKFENSGTSCFNEPPFQDILFAPSENEPEPTASVGWPVASTKYFGSHNLQPDPKLLSDGGSSNIFGNFNHLSDVAFAINGPISNRGKKKELLLDDVGTAAIRAASNLGSTVSGGTKGKRSEREATKSGRASHCERKTKPKPKPKPRPRPRLPTSGNIFVNKLTGPMHPIQPSANRTSQLADDIRDVRFVTQSRKEGKDSTNPSLDDLDPMNELSVAGDELGGPHDLSSFLNFDEQDLEEDFLAGLDIPMDDLTELNMF